MRCENYVSLIQNQGDITETPNLYCIRKSFQLKRIESLKKSACFDIPTLDQRMQLTNQHTRSLQQSSKKPSIFFLALKQFNLNHVESRFSLLFRCSRNAMDETAIYDFSSVSKFNQNPEPLTTGHLHNSKKYNCITIKVLRQRNIPAQIGIFIWQTEGQSDRPNQATVSLKCRLQVYSKSYDRFTNSQDL